MKLLVFTPHFEPDVAPTGAIVTRLVEELAARGHEFEVVTSYPWYREHRVEPGYEGRLVRYEDTPWGRITRIHPFSADDKSDVVRRAISFGAFSAIAATLGTRGGRLDGVLALSPPITLALSGWAAAKARKAPLVFNVQDVYPDVAIELGVLTGPRLIRAARTLERFCYERADVVTVLSEEIAHNVRAKAPNADVRVIPNFVDTEAIRPGPAENAYRSEFGLSGKTVFMYAGNVGLSQSLDTVVEAAAALQHEPDAMFVINGQGAARSDLERRAAGLANVEFVDFQPPERLSEVLAAADVHLVPLKKGLGHSSVPSKTYAILAAGRPLIASVDPGTEVARLVERSGAGIAVAPEDSEALVKAVRGLLEAPEERASMGRSARDLIERWASPRAVAGMYEDLIRDLRS